MRGEGYIVTVLQCYWLLTFTFAFACTFVIYAFTLILYICSLYISTNKSASTNPTRPTLSRIIRISCRKIYRGKRDNGNAGKVVKVRLYCIDCIGQRTMGLVNPQPRAGISNLNSAHGIDETILTMERQRKDVT